MHRCLAVCLLAAACSSQSTTSSWEPGDPPLPEEREHDPRFIGWWIVEQPTHALYEATYYDFRSDGALVVGSSIPDDCSGHLARHCVTGSVANCIPRETGTSCQSELTCVFGDEWWSLDANRLVILGSCSDGRARQILIEMNSDASSNSSWGGAGGRLISVDGERDWTHDNWDWAFRSCPTGPTSCTPS